MKSIRIGKDINLVWTITIDGVSRDLAGLDLTLFLHHDESGVRKQMEFTTSFDTLRFTFAGTEQRKIGVYRATLWLNKGKSGQAVLDDSTAFRLVPRTEFEGGTDDNVQTESVALSGDLETGGVVPQEIYDRLDALETGLAAETQERERKDSELEDEMEQIPTEVVQDNASMVEFVRGTKRCYTIGRASATSAGVMGSRDFTTLYGMDGRIADIDERTTQVERKVKDIPVSVETTSDTAEFINEKDDVLFSIDGATESKAGVMKASQVTELKQNSADIEELKSRPNCPVYDFYREVNYPEEIDAQGWEEFKRKVKEIEQSKAVGYIHGGIVVYGGQVNPNEYEVITVYYNAIPVMTRFHWDFSTENVTCDITDIEIAPYDKVPNKGVVTEDGSLVMKHYEKNLFSVPLPAQEPFYKILQTGASDVTVSPRSSKNVQYDMGLPEGYELGAYLAIGVSQATSGGIYSQIVIKQFATAGGNTKCNITLYNENETEVGKCNLTIKMLAVNTKFKG